MTPTCNGSTIQQIQCALQPLAEKLGQGARFLWSVNLRQTIIDSIIALTIGLTFLGISIFTAYLATKNLKKVIKLRVEEKNDNYSYGSWSGQSTTAAVIGFSALAVAVGSTITWLTLLISGVQHLLNPGYYTYLRILQQ